VKQGSRQKNNANFALKVFRQSTQKPSRRLSPVRTVFDFPDADGTKSVYAADAIG
jgi:hypothetical protein